MKEWVLFWFPLGKEALENLYEHLLVALGPEVELGVSEKSHVHFGVSSSWEPDS